MVHGTPRDAQFLSKPLLSAEQDLDYMGALKALASDQSLGVFSIGQHGEDSTLCVKDVKKNLRKRKSASIGHLIRAARQAAHLTERELAARVGVSGPQISRYENDEDYPGGDNLLSLGRALGLLGAWWELTKTTPPSPNAVDEETGLRVIAPQRSRPRDYDPPDLALLISDLRGSPELIPWLVGAATILKGRDEGARVGLRENIQAFLIKLGKEPIQTRRRKKAAGERG